MALLRRRGKLDDAGRTALAAVLADPTFELLPLKNAADQEAALPPNARVSVTASPAKGLEATVALSVHLEGAGFRVVPHLSARMVREVRPKRVAVRPISIRSPWTAELTKLISEMYFVTARPLPSCRMA